MADNQVSFTITADTKPAVQAIKDIQTALKEVKPVKSVDKNVVRQQNELKRVLEGVNSVLEQNKNNWALYNANVARVKNLTAAFEAQKVKTQEAVDALEAFDKKKEENGTVTGTGKGDYWTRQKLNDKVKQELAEQGRIYQQLEDYKGRVAKVDTEAEQALEHILGKNKELVSDESSLLGYKIQDRNLSEKAAESTSQQADAATKDADATAQTAQSESAATEAARQRTEAIQEAVSATNSLNDAQENLSSDNRPQKTPRATTGRQSTKTTDTLREVREEAESTASVCDTLNARITKAFTFTTADNNIAGLIRHLQDLQAAQRAIEQAGMPKQYDGAYAQIYSEVERTKQAINAYKQSLNGVADEHKQAEKTGVSFGQRASGAFNVLKKAGSGITSLLKSIKSGFGGLDKTTNKVKSSFDGMARNMKSNFKHLVRNITKYVFGFRSLFFLVRRLRKYLVEGIENLVKYEAKAGNSKAYDSTNQAINRLRTSLLFLQNAWAAAFQPAIMVASSILSPFIDWLARAGNAVARFMGVLTGQKTVYQAVKTPAKDYAKSLNKASGSAGKAAKKQKQLNDRIAEFDDLILLGRDKDPNDDNGKGGGSGNNNDDDYDYSKMFKKAKAFSKLADMIKKAWKTGDFTQVGEYVRDNLVKALNKINWKKAEKSAAKIGKSFATFLNGVFADPKLWVKLGETIGKSLNTVGKALEAFFANNKVDWGKGFATFINNIFKNVDEDLLKSNIKSFINLLVDNTVSFLTNLDWKEIQAKARVIGNALGHALNRTFKNPEFAKAVGEAAGELINTIGSVLSGAFEDSNTGLMDQADTTSVGTALATFLMTAFRTINWKDFVKLIGNSLSEFFDAIGDLFSNEEDINEVGETLGEAFEEVDWSTILVKAINAALKIGKFGTKVFAKISNAISDAIINADETEIEDAIKQFIEELNTDDFGESCMIFGEALIKSLIASGALGKIAIGVLKGVVDAIKEKLTGDDDEIPWDDIGNAFVTAFFLAISGGLTGVVELVTKYILDPIASAMAKVFGFEMDDDSQINGWGTNIIEGIKKGISKALSDPIGWVKDLIFNPVSSGVEDNFDMHSPSKVAEGWGENIMTGLANGQSNMLSNVTGIWTTLKSDLTTTWETIKSSILTSAGTFSEKFTKIFEGIKSGLKTPLQGIINAAVGMANGVIDAINWAIRGIKNFLGKIEFPDWFKKIPGIGFLSGKKINFNLSTIDHIKAPKLAQGAVIPPNKEFMAVLGDQTHGTNIEAPLDTIKQAVAEVLATNGNQEVINLLQELIGVVQSKNLVIGDKEIGKANARYVNQQRLIRGTSF